MSSTNGHGPKCAILYARVSTQEQAQHGYSLRQQMERLREYARAEGFEIVAEVEDPGYSGAYLERSGLDRVRDLAEAGGVSVVLAQDADRITRDPAHRAFLDEEMEKRGTRLVALDDWGDDTHEGELLRYLKGWVSKGERLKTTERTRRGKLRKAREGKIVAGHTPTYGFRYNDARDGYEIEPQKMAVVRHIFELVGARGESIYGVSRHLEREGIPSPAGKRVWAKPTIKDILRDDAYLPLAHRQLHSLVEEGNLRAEVLNRLDAEKRYGIWWFNRAIRKERRVAVETPGGREYKKRSTIVQRPRSEWIAVPVPDSEVAPELVDAARNAVKTTDPALPRATISSISRAACSAALAVAAGCGALASSIPRQDGDTFTTNARASIMATGRHAQRKSPASGRISWSPASGGSSAACSPTPTGSKADYGP